ncbi:T9SS type A sorting domain-containing protein [Aureisphaera galaxeae]|uniref:T9SS type A sorting domain-containing protein n=1 Tax=Aureisphaera galaxeae TaxID=1538023 RepID=UPI00234FD3C6|nr:T9SS type A sorting domain-containing protein [Aureisphaera galaxeae]MDC8006067.1 T9SS type A sorting domain-containing protein [Aureisphaera galaxeae]
MKTIYALLLVVATLGTVQAQSLGQTVMANSGATISGASNTLSFTLGEPVIGMIDNGESLGQGFWLGAIVEITLSTEDFSLEANATVYPNPVSNYLNISFKEMAGETFQAMLFDMQGKKVMQQELEASNTAETLSLSALSTGNYVLKVVQESTNKSRTFKIVKN